jgi:hypothetical protein
MAGKVEILVQVQEEVETVVVVHSQALEAEHPLALLVHQQQIGVLAAAAEAVALCQEIQEQVEE